MHNSEPRVTCFDLDGTITDSKVGITRSIQFALERLGRPSPEVEDLTQCIGPPLIDSFESLLGSKTVAKEAVKIYRSRYWEIGLYENELYPRILDVISALAADGHRLFVATSKPTVYAEKIITHFELSKYFEAVFGSELDGARSDKTELLAYLLDQKNLDANGATMIGDRSYDIVGASNNKMKTIGVLYGYGTRFELEKAGAEKICERPDDIAAALI